ncbi:glycosyltransferase family 2 protein [Streptomyces sp. CBMA152]|uniref:glycosyltransferase family 2 protein n=1 Tax=Streptomyces sp. CBMA152 TaxID=1896312 RepID=UPI001660C1C0|nr:glycosyltransferase family 2 protein [Streptomyces sp. CBMA152]MBD0741099.1 glycosyl transferase family 2 [Streptomyces sp. CBMA152]
MSRDASRPDRRAERRDRRNASAVEAYVRAARACGPLANPGREVAYCPVLRLDQRVLLTAVTAATALADIVFIGWLLLPEHVPGPGVTGLGGCGLCLARVGFCLVIGVETIKVVQAAAIWVFAFRAKDPIPMVPPSGLRVAMLTTIVPSKEPLAVVQRTLRAMLEVERWNCTVDVWILDEGDDPAVRQMAARLGVHHFSRKGRPEYNQPSGPFRARTKSGNHNAWRAEHENDYDVVAQMDPDHVPLPCFLERTLGYFHAPDTAFVVAPQVYGNAYDNWVSHGASVQQYLFSSMVERGGNGLDAPLLIGTNHLYRVTAWQKIGGYQDSIIEDHLTSMRVHGTVNPATGNGWKGVYTPDVVAIGEGPTTWTDYFNQQRRWAYGVWEITLNSRLREGIQLRPGQRLLYGLVQFYYPSVAMSLGLGTLATALYMLLGVSSIQLPGLPWFLLWSAGMGGSFALWLWLRRFNLAEHERREIGIAGILLSLFAGPVYIDAAANALLRRPLAYVVTAKGELRSSESLRTFRLHLLWALMAGALLTASFLHHHDYTAMRMWTLLGLAAGSAPPLLALVQGLSTRLRTARAER